MSQPDRSGIPAQRRDDSTSSSQKAPKPAPRPVLSSGTETPRAEKSAGYGGYWPPSPEWALVAVTAFLTFYTFRLFRATKELATGAAKDAERVREVMEKQQAAMEVQAAAMRQTAERQRAYVGIDSLAMDTTGSPARVRPLEIVFRNSGQTPAHQVRVALRCYVREYPLTAPLPVVTSDQLGSPSTLGPGGVFRRAVDNVQVRPDELGAIIVDRSKAVYYCGAIEYRDDAGREHRTNFRLFWHGGMDRPEPHTEGNEAD